MFVYKVAGNDNNITVHSTVVLYLYVSPGGIPG